MLYCGFWIMSRKNLAGRYYFGKNSWESFILARVLVIVVSTDTMGQTPKAVDEVRGPARFFYDKSTYPASYALAQEVKSPGLNIRSTSNSSLNTSTVGLFSAVSTPIFTSKSSIAFQYSSLSIFSRSTRCAFFCTAPNPECLRIL